ncbi:hypothetical protein BGZ47_002178 [Haplosporangium gracile]|nr:hypothetical protein BGZ47_002178 [Haplosporangium gracile]
MLPSLKSLSPKKVTEFEKRLQMLIKKNGYLIRKLALYKRWMLEAALDARSVSNLTNGESEDFFAEMDEPGGVALWSGDEDGYDEEYSSSKDWEQLSLVFVVDERRSLWPLNPDDDAMEFLAGILKQMPRLHRVKIGAFAASYFLQNLTTVALHIILFVYSGGFEEEHDGIYGTFLKELAVMATTCTILQSLKLDWNMRDSTGLRTVLRAFPSLRELILPVHFINLEDRVPFVMKKRSKVIHHHLERITGNTITDLPLPNIRLPNVKHFGSISRVKSDEELVAILTAFSALEHLEMDVLEGADTFLQLVLQQPMAPMDPLAMWATERALKSLIIKSRQYRPNAWTHLFARMPNLIFVHLQYISNEAFNVIGKTCHDLEHIRFFFKDPSKQTVCRPCYPEMAQLLTGCPKLKTCTGRNHATLTSILNVSPDWTCLGSEKLDCEIHGAPHLDGRQHRLLDDMQSQNGTSPRTEEE